MYVPDVFYLNKCAILSHTTTADLRQYPRPQSRVNGPPRTPRPRIAQPLQEWLWQIPQAWMWEDFVHPCNEVMQFANVPLHAWKHPGVILPLSLHCHDLRWSLEFAYGLPCSFHWLQFSLAYSDLTFVKSFVELIWCYPQHHVHGLGKAMWLALISPNDAPDAPSAEPWNLFAGGYSWSEYLGSCTRYTANHLATRCFGGSELHRASELWVQLCANGSSQVLYDASLMCANTTHLQGWSWRPGNFSACLWIAERQTGDVLRTSFNMTFVAWLWAAQTWCLIFFAGMHRILQKSRSVERFALYIVAL